MDKDGYPEDHELEEIENYDLKHGSPKEFFDKVFDLWYLGESEYSSVFIEDEVKITLHTYGWSGNEDIIRAMKKSVMWSLFWYSSHRGGKYTFRIPLEVYNV
jgi:hypothetical protein